MLLAIAILALLTSIVVGAFTGFANMMSDAPDEPGQSQRPTLILLAIAVLLFALWYFGL